MSVTKQVLQMEVLTVLSQLNTIDSQINHNVKVTISSLLTRYGVKPSDIDYDDSNGPLIILVVHEFGVARVRLSSTGIIMNTEHVESTRPVKLIVQAKRLTVEINDNKLIDNRSVEQVIEDELPGACHETHKPTNTTKRQTLGKSNCKAYSLLWDIANLCDSTLLNLDWDYDYDGTLQVKDSLTGRSFNVTCDTLRMI